MMLVHKPVLEAKLSWLDPYMRGPFIQSDEFDCSTKILKKDLNTEEERKELSKEAQAYFWSSDEDLMILKDKAACYGRDLDPVPIDGDCLLHAVRKQCDINPAWTIMENWQTLAFYLAKLPEQFILYANPYIIDQKYESYILNVYHGYSYGDELIASVWGHIWNMKITILSPQMPDLKCFHSDKTFPDVVICHNGKAGTDGHHFATSK